MHNGGPNAYVLHNAITQRNFCNNLETKTRIIREIPGVMALAIVLLKLTNAC